MTDELKATISNFFNDTIHETVKTLDDGGEMHHFLNQFGKECIATYAPDGFEVGFMFVDEKNPYSEVKSKLEKHYDSFRERLATYKMNNSNGIYSRMLMAARRDLFSASDFFVLRIVDNHFRSLRRVFVGL